MTNTTPLTSGDLRAGDILLHQPGNPRWYEKGIAWCTGSSYTHASIVIGDDTIAEARLPRIRTWSIRRTLRREKAICVLRQKADLTAGQIETLRHFVENTLSLGVRYDFAFPYTYFRHQLMYGRKTELMQMAQKDHSVPDRDRYFCAAFVVACLRAMEIIDRSEHRSYWPGQHAPADFLKDEKFGCVLGQIPGSGGKLAPRRSFIG